MKEIYEYWDLGDEIGGQRWTDITNTDTTNPDLDYSYAVDQWDPNIINYSPPDVSPLLGDSTRYKFEEDNPEQPWLIDTSATEKNQQQFLEDYKEWEASGAGTGLSFLQYERSVSDAGNVSFLDYGSTANNLSKNLLQYLLKGDSPESLGRPGRASTPQGMPKSREGPVGNLPDYLKMMLEKQQGLIRADPDSKATNVVPTTGLADASRYIETQRPGKNLAAKYQQRIKTGGESRSLGRYIKSVTQKFNFTIYRGRLNGRNGYEFFERFNKNAGRYG